MVLQLFLILVVIQAHEHIPGHKCIHDELEDLGLTSPVTIKPVTAKPDFANMDETAAATWANIRIHVDYSNYPNNDPAMIWIKEQVIPKAISILNNALTVQPVQGNLRLHARCLQWDSRGNCLSYQQPVYCSGPNFTIPAQYIEEGGGQGVAADFIVFAAGMPTQGSTLAYANFCQINNPNPGSGPSPGRPIAGVINFGINYVRESVKDAEAQQKYIDVAVHEMMHALGFSASAYPLYIDSAGRPLGLSKVTQGFYERRHNVTKLITPKALAIARQFFGCSSLNGVELETQGGPGAAGSHFAMRIFMDDIMKAQTTFPRYEVITKLTLAFFEDMGWYTANYGAASPMYWGSQLGCDFAVGDCIDPTDGMSKFPRYWCTQQGQRICEVGRKAKGICNLGAFSAPLPAPYQYFPGQPNLGGQNMFTDWCPYSQRITTQFGNFVQTSSCQPQSNQMNPNVWGESFGDDSRCFFSSLLRIPSRGPYYQPTGVGCYSISQCNIQQQSYQVKVESTLYSCTSGKTITIQGMRGNLTCAPFSEICPLQ